MNRHLYFALRAIAALIMLQSLYYKFTAAPESIAIFTQLGLEPYGRIGIGIAELIASILLLVPRTIWAGALLTVGLMLSAIFSHLTKLGIEVQGDGGYLFILALITFALGSIAAYLERKHIPILKRLL